MLHRHLPRLLAALVALAPLTRAAAPDPAVFVGTVYNIFHDEFASDAEFNARVDRDIPAMAAANISHVLIFPMSEWDATTRQLKWARTDYLIRKIETTGLKFVPLMLKEEQCSHYFPIWKFDEFPDLKATHMRDPSGRNNRENVDFADPRVFPLLVDYFRAVADRYSTSPALAFYNIWNEPHYEHTGAHVITRFRGWLQEKYGSLEALRRAWGDDYTDWSQVSPLINDDWNSSMPSIDWRQFRNELNGTLLGELAAALRAIDPNHAINANPVGSFLTTPGPLGGYVTDNWQFTAHNEFNGGSYYPDGWDRENSPQTQPIWRHNFAFTAFRSAAGAKPYVLTEIYTNAKGGLALGGYLDRATTSMLGWTALANDCKGLIYWKWEPFMRGRQSLGRGLTRTDGTLAPRGEAVRELGAVMRRHGALLGSARLRAPEVGILVDMVGLLKVLDQPIDPRTQRFMHESIAGTFLALDEANITADVVRTDLPFEPAQLARYKVLILPFQVVQRRDVAARLRDYVRAGGCLVADARCATVDELDYAYERSPGAGLSEVFGCERIDWIGAARWHRVQMPSHPDGGFEGRWFREQLRLGPGTEVLATFADSGEPALVSRREGRGRAVLAAVPLGASYHERPDNPVNRLLLALCAQSGVRVPATFAGASVPQTPMIRIHDHGDESIVYVINASSDPLEGSVAVPGAGTAATRAINLVDERSIPVQRTADALVIPLSLPARGSAVLHLSR